jgi:hypothetical protein
MTILHHHDHPLRTPTNSFVAEHAASTSIAESITTSIPALVRRASCGPKDNSPECEMPVRDNSLAIGLGVAIPLFFVIVSLTWLHFRHIKKLKREEEATKDIDVDNDEFDPTEIKNIQHKSSAYTLNSSGEKGSSVNYSTTSFNPDSPVVPNNPFNQFHYNIPALNSSQKSLNNYDPYDLSAYPPSGTIYETPRLPPSVYTRSSSLSEVTSSHTAFDPNLHNPYGGFSQSQQSFNLESSNLNQSLPKSYSSAMSFSNSSRVSLALSVVSSHTPTVHSFDAQPRGVIAQLDHSKNTSISTISSGESENYKDSEKFEKRNNDLTTSRKEDDDTRRIRIEQTLNQNTQITETDPDSRFDSTRRAVDNSSDINGNNLRVDVVNSDMRQSETASQFSFVNNIEEEENFIAKPTQHFTFDTLKKEKNSKLSDESLGTPVTATNGLAISGTMEQHAGISTRNADRTDTELNDAYQKHMVNSLQVKPDDTLSSAVQITVAIEQTVVSQDESEPTRGSFRQESNLNPQRAEPIAQQASSPSDECQSIHYSQYSQNFNSNNNGKSFSQQANYQEYNENYATNNYTLISNKNNNSSSTASSIAYQNNNYYPQSVPRPIRQTSNHPLQNVQSVESIHAELQNELQYSPSLRQPVNGTYDDYPPNSSTTSHYSDTPVASPSVSTFSLTPGMSSGHNSRVSSPKIPKNLQQLPQFEALPTPHKLDDSKSTIEYASQRRKTSSSQPSSPSFPAYNPVTSPISTASFDEKSELPSPSQLRQSVVMFMSNDYAVPKKFGNGSRSRSNSLRSENGNFQPSRQRPPSELVPDIKSQMEKLRPQMNMSMR